MPLLVLEGIDGCGKTTQNERLQAALRDAGHDPLCLREPGGTALGEKIRELLLEPTTVACPKAELFGYQMARAQLVDEIIRPAITSGRVVLLDRFWYSTIAYQGFGLGMDIAEIRGLIDVAIGDLVADCALYFRIPVQVAAERRAAERGDDRIEARGLAYLEKVRQGYEALVDEGQLQAVDATVDREVVAQDVWSRVSTVL